MGYAIAERHFGPNGRPPAVPLQNFPKLALAINDIFSSKRELEGLVKRLSLKESIMEDFESVFKAPIANTYLCDQKRGGLVSLYHSAKNKLKDAPIKLKSYQETFNAVSKSDVDHAVAENKIDPLDEIAYRYPFTVGAKVALMRLTSWYLDRGEFDVAAIYADTLLEDFSIDSLGAGTLKRLAMIYEVTHQKEKAQKIADFVGGSKSESLDSVIYGPHKNRKDFLTALVFSSDPKDREMFLRLSRIRSPTSLINDLKIKPAGIQTCLLMGLNEEVISEFALETSRLKINMGFPIQDCISNFNFVDLKPGKFLMGAPGSQDGAPNTYLNEVPHEVELTKGFSMQTTEVTEELYELIMGENPERGGLHLPVRLVSWNDAERFVKKLGELDPKYNYRLPTEVEWEYAAGAGSKEQYCFGDDKEQLLQFANISQTRFPDKIGEVGKLKPNVWGLFDMHGNVTEWTLDTYETDASLIPVDKDFGHPVSRKGDLRVIKGGSYREGAERARLAKRTPLNETVASLDNGFRVVRVPQ